MTTSPLHVIIGLGVLGRAIAEVLLREGARVRLVSRSGRTADLVGAESFAADITHIEAICKACEGASVVYQCAAPAYQNWEREFPPLQENVLQAAKLAGAVLVVAENLYGYGVAGTLIKTLPLTATTRKGRTRAIMSNRLFDAHTNGEVRAVSGRASDFFGPGVTMSSMGERVWPKLLAGKTVDWYGNPDLPHSLTYVPDFARTLIELGRNERAWGRPWHVPSPAPLTLRQVLDRAAGLAGLPAPRIRPTPKWLLQTLGLLVPAAGEVVEMAYSYETPFVIDDSDYRREFAGDATDLDTALRATIAFWSATRAADAT